MAIERKAALIEQGLLRGEDIEKAKEAASAQEKFDQSVKRIKDLFTDLVTGGTIDTLVNSLERFVSSIERKGLKDTILFGPDAASDIAADKSEEYKKKAESEQNATKKAELLKKAEEEDKKSKEQFKKEQKEYQENFNILTVGALDIPDIMKYYPISFEGLADGGITKGPQTRLIGEAGPEAVVPLTEFYAKIDQLIAAVNRGGNVYLDLQKVGSTTDQGTYRLNS